MFTNDCKVSVFNLLYEWQIDIDTELSGIMNSWELNNIFLSLHSAVAVYLNVFIFMIDGQKLPISIKQQSK